MCEEEKTLSYIHTLAEFVVIIASVCLVSFSIQHVSIQIYNGQEFFWPIINAPISVYFQQIPKSIVLKNYTIFSNGNYSAPPLYMRKKKDAPVDRNVHIFPHEGAFKRDFNFYHLTNVFCGTECDIIYNSNITYVCDSWGRRNSKHLRPISGVLDHAIYLSAAGTLNYGDMIMGSFVRMIVIPEEYYRKSTLVVHKGSYTHMFHEVLSILGLPQCQLCQLNSSILEIVFCRNLYTVFPFLGVNPRGARSVHLEFFGPIMRKFGNMMLDRTNSTLKPYDYAVYNRFKGMRRSFANFDEIIIALQTTYPMHNFTTIIGHQKTLVEAISRYGIVKWLFSVAGSNSMNCIFMRPRTMVCLYMANMFDSPAVGAILGSDVMLVSYMNDEQDWLGKPLNVNISRMMRFVNRSMEMLIEEEIRQKKKGK